MADAIPTLRVRTRDDQIEISIGDQRILYDVREPVDDLTNIARSIEERRQDVLKKRRAANLDTWLEIYEQDNPGHKIRR